MSAQAKLEALNTLIDRQLTAFQQRRERDKRRAFMARLAQASATATVTVLLGLNVARLGLPDLAQEWLKALALLISAAATVIAAWDAFFDHRTLWVRYTGTVTALRTLQSDVAYTAAGRTVSLEEVDAFYARLQAILEETNRSWQVLRTTQSMPPQTKSLDAG